MAKTSDIVLVAALAIGAYVLYNTFRQKPWTQEQASAAVQSAGGTTYKTQLGEFWEVPGGSVKITDGWTPNFAQRALIGFDKILPGDWLTRKVLGV